MSFLLLLLFLIIYSCLWDTCKAGEFAYVSWLPNLCLLRLYITVYFYYAYQWPFSVSNLTHMHKPTPKLTGELICWKWSCLRSCVDLFCSGSWIEWVGENIRPFPVRIHVADLELYSVVELGGRTYLKRLMPEQHLHWLPRTSRVNPGSVICAHTLRDLALAHFSTFIVGFFLSLILLSSKPSNSLFSLSAISQLIKEFHPFPFHMLFPLMSLFSFVGPSKFSLCLLF